MPPTAPPATPVAWSAKEYLRGACGGLLFGMPLLYTMEMWWHGFLLPWWKIVLLLALAAFFVAAYVTVGGFRREHTHAQRAADVLVSFGIGALVATGMLVLLGQLSLADPLRESVGKVALETVPVAMGVAVSRVQLGARPGAEDEEEGDEARAEPGVLGQAVVSAGGAMLFAFNVAPTEEPMMLGVQNEWWRITALLLVTVPVALAVVWVADFQGGHAARAREARTPLRSPLGETLLSVLVALLVAAVLLWIFGRVDAGTDVRQVAHQVVTLGFVATLGASAARLLV